MLTTNLLAGCVNIEPTTTNILCPTMLVNHITKTECHWYWHLNEAFADSIMTLLTLTF